MKLKLACLLAIGVIGQSNAVQAETISEALFKCSKESNSLKRLVCYDRLTQQAKGYTDVELPRNIATGNVNVPRVSRSQSPETSESPTTIAVQPRTAEQRFGLSEKVEYQDKDLDVLTLTLQDIKKDPRNKRSFYLENGQVWKQTDDASILIKSGDTAIIEKGLLGAYFLKKEGTNRRVKVKRIK